MRTETGPALLHLYGRALREYVLHGDEAHRAAAYSLGRRALESSLGLVHLLQVHLQLAASGADATRSLEFLAEVAGPFEMALRGYREANDSLRALSASLRSQVEERTRALQEAEQRFRTLVERLPAATYVAAAGNPAHRYISPQLESMLGDRPAEWLAAGAGWLDRVEPPDVEQVQQSFATRTPGARLRLEFRIRARDGRLVWIRDECALIEVPGEDGPLRQGLWTDITELRALEAQLQHAQRIDTLGQLAGGVAHDFNNVLTAILSFGGFVLADLPPGHPSIPDLEEVVKAGHRGAALTRQLLALSRRPHFAPALLRLDEVVAEMEKLLHRLLGERITLRTERTGTVWPVRADRGQLEQVLLNLVVNARDAMADGGTIGVETANATLAGGEGRFGAAPGEYVRLRVTDTGCGIDPAALDRIFEPFFTTKAPGRGTGLGLAVVAGIVKQCGGDLAVRTAAGAGSVFEVFLPRASEATEEVPPRADPRTHSGTETLVLVEDETEVRLAARRALSGRGYQVLEAATGAEAEELIRAHPGPVALVVSDVVLTDTTGPELLERLRAVRPGLKALFVSGYTGTANVSEAVAAAGAAFLQKPFSPEQLAGHVRAVLDREPPHR